jgi:Flp pilus assembly protein TadG
MIIKSIHNDTRGSSLIEFTVTFPLFLLLMFGIFQAGLLLFTYTGLQHGVERAARCASVNYAANQLGLNQSCFIVSGSAVAPGSVTGTTIQQYAAQSSWGIVPASTSFTVKCPHTSTTGCTNNNNTCATGLPGFLVSVNHTYSLIGYIFSMTLTTTSCFPITVS